MAVGLAPGEFGAVLLALDSGIVFKVSCRSRVALRAGDPDLGGCAEGEAGVNDRPDGTCGR